MSRYNKHDDIRLQWLNTTVTQHRQQIQHYNTISEYYNYDDIRLIHCNKCSVIRVHHMAAYTIQHWWKSTIRNKSVIHHHTLRRTNSHLYIPHIHTLAAITIQYWYRLQLHKQYINRSTPTLYQYASDYKLIKSAELIQKWYRRYVDRKSYRYMRWLLYTANSLTPAQLLQSINCGESYLCRDKSMNCYVRLRLGTPIANSFPPLIYYKIFTTMNVTDINSYAPCDYTQPSIKSINTDKYNIVYQRNDMNGWRILSNDIVQLNCSESRPRAYPHQKLTRQIDYNKRMKQIKMNWMKKLYTQTNKPCHEETSELNENELDELLQWSNNIESTQLRYDTYYTDWIKCAVTK